MTDPIEQLKRLAELRKTHSMRAWPDAFEDACHATDFSALSAEMERLRKIEKQIIDWYSGKSKLADLAYALRETLEKEFG